MISKLTTVIHGLIGRNAILSPAKLKLSWRWAGAELGNYLSYLAFACLFVCFFHTTFATNNRPSSPVNLSFSTDEAPAPSEASGSANSQEPGPRLNAQMVKTLDKSCLFVPWSLHQNEGKENRIWKSDRKKYKRENVFTYTLECIFHSTRNYFIW